MFFRQLSMNIFLSNLSSIDLTVFHAINGWCGQNIFLDKFMGQLEDLQLKGLAFIGTFGALWFRRSKGQTRQREILILLLFAVVLSPVVAVRSPTCFPFAYAPCSRRASGIGRRFFR